MNEKIKELLEKIKERENRYEKFEYTPCSERDIEKFNAWLKTEFGDSAPDLSEFIEFCKVADGLNSNGVFMFSLSQDKYVNVYVQNEHFWEAMNEKNYLLIGSDDISDYAVELSSGKFCVLDSTCGDCLEYYDGYDNLMEEALSIAEGPDEDEDE